MYILEKLWQGQLVPGERLYRPREAYGEFFKAKERCEAAMKAELSAAGAESPGGFL